MEIVYYIRLFGRGKPWMVIHLLKCKIQRKCRTRTIAPARLVSPKAMASGARMVSQRKGLRSITRSQASSTVLRIKFPRLACRGVISARGIAVASIS